MDCIRLIKVTRLHLADRIRLTALSWGVLAIALVVNLAVARSLSGHHGLAALAMILLASGYLTMRRLTV